MEMPDLIYAAHKIYPNDSGSEWMEQNGLGREIYYHDRIVESLRRENEELKAKLDKAIDIIKDMEKGDDVQAFKEARKFIKANEEI